MSIDSILSSATAEAVKALYGLEMHVTYISTIAQAQRASALEPLVQGIEFANQVAQADPLTHACVNYERALAEGLENLGVDQVLLSPKTQVNYETNAA